VKRAPLDTGVIVALLDRSERYHARCVQALENLEQPLATCEAVIAESCYLLRIIPGAAETVLANVEQGIFQIPMQLNQAAAPIRAILRKYRDVPADLADACLIHLADELDTGEILTLDSDFARYRWRRNRAFQLLIPLKQ
jgi:predicted nucleic acid-binding protein